jgi:hypothetical protein
VTTYLDAHTDAAASELGARVHVSLTLRHHGATVRVASSSERAARCDQAEARTEDGPCVVAMVSLESVLVPDVDTEQRWPAWSRAARDARFASVLAVPARVDPTTAVALNLYFEAGRTCTPQDRVIALRRAEAVASDIDARLAAADVLPAAPAAGTGDTDDALIDQAVGAVMQGNGCDARAARAVLELIAMRDGVAVRQVATDLLATITQHQG